MSDENTGSYSTLTLPCSEIDARRVGAMLDVDTSHLSAGVALPLGWHFFAFGGDTRRSALRSDGFPGLGVEMPDLGLPRLVIAGREVQYLSPLIIGEPVTRRSRIAQTTHKETRSGKIAIVVIAHELSQGDEAHPLVTEKHTYYLMPDGPRAPVKREPPAVMPTVTRTVTPDEILLFQYSALGFNSHRIHIDRTYVQDVEGYPDLLVNGGLATLLLTEFLQREIGVTPKAVKARHLAPLFCGRPLTLGAAQADGQWRLMALDENGTCAVDMEVTSQ